MASRPRPRKNQNPKRSVLRDRGRHGIQPTGDSSEYVAAELQAHERAALQEALARLGQEALSLDNAEQFLDEAAQSVSAILKAEYVLVQEFDAERHTLIARLALGWRRRSTAQRTVSADPGSQAGFTLLAGEPVIIADYQTDIRFAPPAGAIVASGMSVVIPGQPRPFGVLSIFTRQPRVFSNDEVHFLRAVANVVGTAVNNDRAVRALRDSEQRMRAVVDTAVDAIVTIDERGIIESVNPATLRLFGYSAGELIGSNVSMLMPEPDRSRHDNYLATYLRTGKARIIGIGREVVGRRRDGSIFPLDLSVSEFRHRGRRMFTGAIHDLTDRRRLEREIVEAASEVQRRIGRDLHDGLCQQLTGCAFALEVLEQKLTARAAPESRTVQEVAELVNDAITQARKVAHGLHPVSLDATGLEVALRDLAARSQALMQTSCSYVSPAPVRVDDNTVATHLYRIAQEAINNAVKHGRARKIVIELTSDASELRMSVRDDGIGLGKAVADGKGIGLHTMDYRARIIGGRLELRPQPSGGTQVICIVPVASIPQTNTQVKHGRKRRK